MGLISHIDDTPYWGKSGITAGITAASPSNDSCASNMVVRHSANKPAKTSFFIKPPYNEKLASGMPNRNTSDMEKKLKI